MTKRRGSREPCGLKWVSGSIALNLSGRGSREPCGLKCDKSRTYSPHTVSRLARALWIEILRKGGTPVMLTVEARESLVD